MSDSTWWLELGDLDDEQTAIVNLGLGGSHLILGPPGSGKTNLLLLRAAYLTRSQLPNIIVLVFTRSLREFIARGTNHYELHREQVQTLAAWGLAFLQEHSVRTDDLPEDHIDCRREIASRIAKILDDTPALSGTIDCVFVDEIQDCLPEEIEIFFRIGEEVCFAGDDRQRIYDVACDTVEQLESRIGEANTRRLHFHYRNGLQICKAADAIGKTSGHPPIADHCNYNEPSNPSRVDFRSFPTQSQQILSIAASLETDLKTFPGELLGVACPLRKDVETLRNALLASPIGRHVLPEKVFDQDEGRCIYVTTLHDFKGLEFRVGHLAFMESLYRLRGAQKRIAYTAVTRAKTLLTVYSDGRIPGYLQRASAATSPPVAPPAVSALFPGRGSQ